MALKIVVLTKHIFGFFFSSPALRSSRTRESAHHSCSLSRACFPHRCEVSDHCTYCHAFGVPVAWDGSNHSMMLRHVHRSILHLEHQHLCHNLRHINTMAESSLWNATTGEKTAVNWVCVTKAIGPRDIPQNDRTRHGWNNDG